MKNMMRSLIAGLALMAMQGVASADIVSSDAEPSANVLLDAISGGTAGGVINAGAAQGARGTAFTLPAGSDYNVSGLTIQANTADTFAAGEEFTVALYTGTAGTFTAATNFANVTPSYLDTNSGLTLLAQETFAANSITGDATAGTVGGGDYLTFDFASDVAVADGEAITAFVFTNFAFSHREGSGNGGGRLQFRETTTALAGSASRDFRFSVLGTVAVPEPSSLALLGLGALGLVARRRR